MAKNNKELHLLIKEHESREQATISRDNTTLSQRLHEFLRSPLILKGLSLVFGLWEPHRGPRALFSLMFIIPNVYWGIMRCFTLFVCSTASVSNATFCIPTSVGYNASGIVRFPFHINVINVLFFLYPLLGLSTNLVFFLSIWRIPYVKNVVLQAETCSLVKPTSWLKINCQIAFLFVLIFIDSVTSLYVPLQNLINPYTVCLFVAVPITLSASLIKCWIFGSLTSSLKTLTSRCIDDITASGNLNDIIKIHQKLCKTITATSNSLKFWFVLHWSCFTVFCVLWAVSLTFKYLDIMTIILHTSINIYEYMYPCLCAASLTTKCQEMLVDFNLKCEAEWHETHPFRQRKQLHIFLKYASYTNCGYKVGRVTFGSISVRLTTLLAVIGFGFKIFFTGL